MTAHSARAAGCSAAEIRVFESIALGHTTGHCGVSLALLEISGLVTRRKGESFGTLGAFTWVEAVLTPRARAAYDDYLATPRSA
jgi:hypothetical protein